jgi:hypothetical protein
MVKNPSPVPTRRLGRKVENKNAKRKNEKKCNAKGNKILQKENENLEKTQRICFNQQEKLYIFS